jgi:AraC family transcriptional regulator, transcriptional activator of pobA
MEPIFNIFQLGPDDAERIAATPEEPHTHTYNELIFGIQGALDHFIDFQKTVLQSPFVSFVTKGKMHLAKPQVTDGNCKMWVIRFGEEFLPELAYELYNQFHASANFEVEPDSRFQRLLTICEMIHNEMNQPSPHLLLVRDLLKALLTMVRSMHEKHTMNETNNASNIHNTTFRNFLKILEENFRRDVSVDFYAEKLFMTSRNLNLVCQQVVGKSVSEIIEERKMTEGKKLLTHTNKTISEIGYEIGYNEKACFTTVFKKKNGQTPTEFRKQIKRLIS